VRLTVLYDGDCPICNRARAWLEREPKYVPLELLDARGPEAARRYQGITAKGTELVVVADDGRVWIGPGAFLMCLWALREWREWSLRLGSPLLAPAARAAFRTLSAGRFRLAALLDYSDCARGQCTPLRQ
jgi:predicted DCC family thiol-disulfide oxidoreductase YuxK